MTAPTCQKCETAPAVHRNPQGGVVCHQCLPKGVMFAPFLGWQENLMSRRERYILAGGGAGPGKTTACSRMYFPQLFTEKARWVADPSYQSTGWFIFFRRVSNELIQVREDFKRYYLKIDPGARWNEVERRCTFSWGYHVQFAGVEFDDDIQKFFGPEWTMLVVDEAAQFSEAALEALDSRVRSTDPVLGDMLQTVFATNPLGQSKQYLKDRFVKAAPPGEPAAMKTTLRDGRTLTSTQIYLPGNVYDNPMLMRDGRYEENLMAKPERLRRALLNNDWETPEGSWVGDDWDSAVHICPSFVVPSGWFKFKSGDYGYTSRSSIQWWAVDPEGNMVCYRYLTVTKHLAEDLAMRIREEEMKPLTVTVNSRVFDVVPQEWDERRDMSPIYGPMDNSLWARQGEQGDSRGETMDRLGSGFFRSSKGRESMADALRTRLRNRTPNAKGEMVVPGIRWMQHCVCKYQSVDGRGRIKWIETSPMETIPSVQVDPTPGKEDCWATGSASDDHDLDAAGYACLYKPLVPVSDSADENRRVIDDLRERRRVVGERRRGGSTSGFPGMI